MNIVYAYFVLDIVHRGHLMMLKNSKAIAGPEGRLIVGIVSDKAVLEKKGKVPVLDFSERLELANSIQYVDLVVGQKNYTPRPRHNQSFRFIMYVFPSKPRVCEWCGG